MIELTRLTVCLADTRNYANALSSLQKTLSKIKPARAIFFTDIDIPNLPEGIEIIKIPTLYSKADYSTWVIRELWKHVQTEFMLIVQWDSWVLNSECWSDEFLEYDYLGPAWLGEDQFNVGNGGVSIRSLALMKAAASDPVVVATHPEDNVLCKIYRPHFEAKYGFKWAPDEVADKFAFELRSPIRKTFAFHSFFHKEYLDTICIRRQAALGDVVHIEPVLEYYNSKGYRVVLDTLPQFYNLFIQHYFKIYHPQEIDRRIKYKTINLDMSYESRPKQLHLQSYFEFCGISDYKLRNPRLTLNFDPKHKENKLFSKYCVLHLDVRSQKSRNLYGIDWNYVSEFLWANGYKPIVIGRGEHPKIKGAVEMNTPTELMLMWIVGGADLFLGIDSGPSNIAVAMGTKSIILSGSVDLRYIYAGFTNIEWLHNHHSPICREPFCWHSLIGTEGRECVELEGSVLTKTKMLQGAECPETNDIPPCVKFTTDQVLNAISKMINNDKN